MITRGHCSSSGLEDNCKSLQQATRGGCNRLPIHCNRLPTKENAMVTTKEVVQCNNQ